MLAEHGSAARFSDPAGDLQHVLWQPNEIGPDRVAEIGGKARGLLLLEQAAVPVPAWCVMPAAVARLRPWRDKGLPLERLRRMLSAAEPAEWIVRSSAEGEDEAHASYAGVFASQRISSLQDQIRAIEHVLDSAADNTAASYARHRGLAGSQGLSVIIQRWVEAKISGILFSAHPTRGHPRKFLLEVVTGSGSAVESGQLEPSRFEVGFEDQCILSAQPSANGPESLEAQLLEHLADYALRAEEAFGTLLDIEWVVEGDRLWVVQARPITSLRADPSLLPPFRATSWFFDQRFLEPIRPITATTLVPTVVKLAIAEPLALLGRSVPEPLYGPLLRPNLRSVLRVPRPRGGSPTLGAGT